MLKWPILIIAFMAFMAAQTAFFSGLPAPFNGVDLYLIAVTGLIASFRPGPAYAVALAGGLARDLATAAPVGTHTVVAFAVAALLNLLFERVITNLSLLSFSVLNAVGYLAYGILAAALQAAGGLTAGHSLAAGALDFGGALLAQTAAAALLLLTLRLISRQIRTRFLYSEHA